MPTRQSAPIFSICVLVSDVLITDVLHAIMAKPWQAMQGYGKPCPLARSAGKPWNSLISPGLTQAREAQRRQKIHGICSSRYFNTSEGLPCVFLRIFSIQEAAGSNLVHRGRTREWSIVVAWDSREVDLVLCPSVYPSLVASNCYETCLFDKSSVQRNSTSTEGQPG